MKKDVNIPIKEFINLFPEVELPIVLTKELRHTFSVENKPLSALMIEQFLLQNETADEFTEYIACFSLPNTDGFHAIVYWKAGLMEYQYILATYTENGQFIDKRVIAGTYSDGKMLTESITTIETDWLIYIVTGQIDAKQKTYDALKSKAFELELLADGQIINAV